MSIFDLWSSTDDRTEEIPPVEDEPRKEITPSPAPVDRAFRTATRTAAVADLVIMALIGTFLFIRATPAWHKAGWSFFTEQEWLPESGRFGIGAVLFGTVLIAVIAMVIALPLAIGTALCISELVPERIRRPLVSLIDLMAAIPSIVYALWGFFFLQPRLIHVAQWLSVHASWFPPFRVPSGESASAYASSPFIAGTVVSLVVIPLVCSLTREVFSQAPQGEREAALALGSSQWGMIRTVVLPFGKGGIIGASMLGLGRALGETITVYAIISPIFTRSTHILETGGNSIAALIAIRFPDSDSIGIAALMGAGFVLFILTLVVNAFAATIISRSRSGALTEI
jgi:phosphate transport system permease protein